MRSTSGATQRKLRYGCSSQMNRKTLDDCSVEVEQAILRFLIIFDNISDFMSAVLQLRAIQLPHAYEK